MPVPAQPLRDLGPPPPAKSPPLRLTELRVRARRELLLGQVVKEAGVVRVAVWVQRLRRALESAQALDARMSQLRAATRLCRMPQESSDAQQSRRLLESVYATFAEGFTTADLSAARDLLKG